MTNATTVTSPAQTLKAADLLALLTRQCGLFETLQNLAMQQSALIEQGQSDPLMAILAHRQRLIDELILLNRQLEPARTHWDQLLASLSAQDRAQAGNLLQRISKYRDRILDQDERDARQLQESQSRAAAELGQIAKAGLAVQSYQRRPAAWNSATTTDRQG